MKSRNVFFLFSIIFILITNTLTANLGVSKQFLLHKWIFSFFFIKSIKNFLKKKISYIQKEEFNSNRMNSHGMEKMNLAINQKSKA